MLPKVYSAFSLVLIVILTIVMSLIAIIFMLILGKSVFHRFARFWAKSILVLSGVRLQISGIELLDMNKTYIFCVNHSSMLDIPILQSAIPHNFRIIYKKELEKIPIFGWGLAQSPYIGIRRQSGRDSMAGIDEAVQSVKTGDSVVIFPEGTRSDDGKLSNFKRGAFLLASRSEKEIVPVTIIGSSKLLPNKKILIKHGTIKVIISNPIEYHGTSKADEMELMNGVYSIIEKNLS